MASSISLSCSTALVTDSSTSITSSKALVPIVVSTGKRFYQLDFNGRVFNGDSLVVDIPPTPNLYKITYELFLKTYDKEHGVEEFTICNKIFHERTDRSYYPLSPLVVNLNEEEALPSAVDEFKDITVRVDGTLVKIFVPKFPTAILQELSLKGFQVEKVESKPKYDLDHPDVAGLFDAFLAIPEITDEFSAEELGEIKNNLIPILLAGKDGLIQLHEADTGHRLEFKMSGKPSLSRNKSDCLLFSTSTGKHFYSSIKILGDGSIAFHFGSRSMSGGYKKARDKVLCLASSPKPFIPVVKVSPDIRSFGWGIETFDSFKEWRLLAQIGAHPNIPSVFLKVESRKDVAGVSTPIQQVYMESGVSLDRFMKKTFPKILSEVEAAEEYSWLMNQFVHVMIQVTEAIQHIHSFNHIHQDIKPENIVIKISYDEDDRIILTPFIIDFGYLVHIDDCRDRETYPLLGTQAFMVAGGLISYKKDAFALGVTLEEVGRTVFSQLKESITKSSHLESSKIRELRSENLRFAQCLITSGKELRYITEQESLTEYIPDPIRDYEKKDRVEYTPHKTLAETVEDLSKFFSRTG